MLTKENLPFRFLECVSEMEDKGKPAHTFYLDLQKKPQTNQKKAWTDELRHL